MADSYDEDDWEELLPASARDDRVLNRRFHALLLALLAVNLFVYVVIPQLHNGGAKLEMGLLTVALCLCGAGYLFWTADT